MEGEMSKTESKTIEVFETRKRGWDIVLICAAAIAYANVASAQDLGFLNMTSGFLKAFVGHEVWGVALGCVFVWELIMLGLTKKLVHLIGMIVPGVVAAAWVNRSTLFSSFTSISL
jgi:hypothetical protein